MTVLSPISYVVRWSVEVAVVPVGAGSMEVPSAQRLKLTQTSPLGGGSITVASTGLFPSSTNFTSACTTAGTNMGAAVTAAAALAQIQGFATGGG